ncbi:hypothetical protein B0O80DRAFT_33482 [Mortierella sp. GBAus27b]|nr:hypothetical protein B0O80DRAFT_33482 [Mortierella sp. GBAus27b]
MVNFNLSSEHKGETKYSEYHGDKVEWNSTTVIDNFHPLIHRFLYVKVSGYHKEKQEWDGTIKCVIIEDGIIEDGIIEDSITEDGNIEDGNIGGGITEDGNIEDGITEDGITEDGNIEDGNIEDGIIKYVIIEDGEDFTRKEEKREKDLIVRYAAIPLNQVANSPDKSLNGVFDLYDEDWKLKGTISLTLAILDDSLANERKYESTSLNDHKERVIQDEDSARPSNELTSNFIWTRVKRANSIDDGKVSNTKPMPPFTAWSTLP